MFELQALFVKFVKEKENIFGRHTFQIVFDNKYNL